MKSSNSSFFLGADGCNGGWIVAILGSNLRIERFSSIGEILETYPDYSAFLIDMVIGLRDSAKQLRPDDIARTELKPRGATLFPVPSREAVYKETYEEQKKANIKTLGKSLPKQASAIIPKIREVDEFMSARPEYKNRIDESHPELDFARLKSSVLLTRKKDADGIEERLKVIKIFIPGINVPDLYAKAKDLRCNVDDIADAICLAVTAKLKSEGLCETIPENPQMDSNGLYMKLTVPKRAVSNEMTEISRLTNTLAEIANLTENMLKKNGQFIELDYSAICFDHISNDEVKNFRKRLHCFRHSSDDAIKERESYSDEQKNFMVDYGLTILKVIYSLVG